MTLLRQLITLLAFYSNWNLCTAEKPWTEEYDNIHSWKLQRVGGKRVMAFFRSSGVHPQQV